MVKRHDSSDIDQTSSGNPPSPYPPPPPPPTPPPPPSSPSTTPSTVPVKPTIKKKFQGVKRKMSYGGDSLWAGPRVPGSKRKLFFGNDNVKTATGNTRTGEDVEIIGKKKTSRKLNFSFDSDSDEYESEFNQNISSALRNSLFDPVGLQAPFLSNTSRPPVIRVDLSKDLSSCTSHELFYRHVHTLGFTSYEVPPDGDCWFHTCLVHLKFEDENSLYLPSKKESTELRHTVVDLMREYFEGQGKQEWEAAALGDLEEYLMKMRTPGVYADGLTQDFTSRHFKRPVYLLGVQTCGYIYKFNEEYERDREPWIIAWVNAGRKIDLVQNTTENHFQPCLKLLSSDESIVQVQPPRLNPKLGGTTSACPSTDDKSDGWIFPTKPSLSPVVDLDDHDTQTTPAWKRQGWLYNVSRYLGSIVQTDIPLANADPSTVEPKPRNVKSIAPSYLYPANDVDITAPVTTEMVAHFKQDTHHLVKDTQFHTCRGVCFKYGSKTCRFKYPKPLVHATGFKDGVILRFRSSSRTNYYNRAILVAGRHNMDCKFITNSQDAKSTILYITDYITKADLSLYDITSILHAAVEKVEGNLYPTKYNPDLTESENVARRRIFTTLNKIDASQERSAQWVISMLLGLNLEFKSHKFKVFNARPLSVFLCNSKPDTCTSQGPSLSSTIPSSSALPVQEEYVAPILNKKDARTVVKGNSQRVNYLLRTKTVTDRYFVDPETSARSLEEYYHRFTPYKSIDLELSQMDPYEYSMRVSKVPFSKTQKESVGEHASHLIDLLPNQSRFSEDHPQFNTHIQVIADISNPRVPPCIPTVLGYILPKEESDPEKFFLILISIFTPYTMGDAHSITIHPTTQESMSWEESWNLYMSVLKINDPLKHLWITEKVRNMNMLRTGRDIQKKERAEQSRLMKEQGIVPTRNPDRPADGPYDHEAVSDDEGEDEASTFDMHDGNLLQCLHRYGALAFKHLPSKTKLGYDKLCKPLIGKLSTHPSLDTGPAPEHGNRDGYVTTKKREDALIEAKDDCTAFQEAVQERKALLRQEPSPDGSRRPQHVALKTVQDIISECNLDVDQEAAFLTIAYHIMKVEFWKQNPETKEPEQLIFYLGGEGGTGKSAVLKALDILLKNLALTHTLRKIAPTGVAAGNIDGSTIHSMLKIQIKTKGKKNTATDQTARKPNSSKKSTQEVLAGEFQHVRTIFVDEVSMIGCSLSNTLNCTLKKVMNEPDKPFGGLTMIFAGDFHQLTPVSNDPLFAKPTAEQKTNYTNALAGFIAFNSINKAVILQTQHRIKDPEYKDVVQNFRHGVQTQNDIDYLEAHKITTLREGPISELPKEPVIIVQRNRLKSYINQSKAVLMANSTKQKMLYCVANDSFKVSDVPMIVKIQALHAPSNGRTNYTCGILPLYPGMPIMTKKNIATELGVSNGSTGTIHRIILDDREEVNFQDINTPHYLVYPPIAVYVKLDVSPDRDGNIPTRIQIPNHEPNVFPILFPTEHRDSKDISYTHNTTKTEYKIGRRQFPFTPAFAITVYSSQGRTLNGVIVHLDGNFGNGEIPYVMLSRLTNGECLGIIGDWNDLAGLSPNQTMIRYMETNILPKVESTMSDVDRIRQTISALHRSIRS